MFVNTEVSQLSRGHPRVLSLLSGGRGSTHIRRQPRNSRVRSNVRLTRQFLVAIELERYTNFRASRGCC